MTFFANRAPKAVRPFLKGDKTKIISFRMEKMFFDRVKLQERIGKANAKALSRAGAFIQRRAKTKILRRRKRASAPGQPPSVHAPTGEKVRTLKFITFELNRDWESLVVGPKLIPTKGNNATVNAGFTVPQILEHGGTIQIKEEKPPDTPNVNFDWRKEGVYNNPQRRANPRKKRKYAKGRRRKSKSRWKPWPKGKYKQNQPLMKRTRRARIAKRPFMAVALREEIAAGTISKAWRSTVVGAE